MSSEFAEVQGMNPLLVQLYDSHRLYEMASDKSPQARAELMHTVTSLLNLPLKTSESELVCDILISLMRQAETDLRQALAERLSIIENVPLRLILKLAHDEIGIAEKVLRRSPVLNDLDLIYLIQAQGPDYWRAIAARNTMGEAVVDALAETRDMPTAITLANNEAVSLTQKAVQILVDLAKGYDDLARPLLNRAEIPAELAQTLYDHVGDELKRIIVGKKGDVRAEIEQAIDDVLSEFTGRVEPAYMPSDSMVQAAEMFAAQGELTAGMMIRTLKRGQLSSYIAYFSRFTGMNAHMVLSILQQKCGQGLAISCKATNVAKNDFIAMFMLTQRLRSSDGVVDQAALQKAITYYDRISKPVALRIMRGSVVGYA